MKRKKYLNYEKHFTVFFTQVTTASKTGQRIMYHTKMILLILQKAMDLSLAQNNIFINVPYFHM